jgi:hypothetical protein
MDIHFHFGEMQLKTLTAALEYKNGRPYQHSHKLLDVNQQSPKPSPLPAR